MKLKALVGSGDKIAVFVLPFLVVGLTLNLLYPGFFSVDLSAGLGFASIIMLLLGIIVWAWSVTLILIRVPQNKLITNGPFRLVKHPLYTGVALMVLPFAGLLLNSWLGIVIGVALYVGSRIFSPLEEKKLLKKFGQKYNQYTSIVIFPWL